VTIGCTTLAMLSDQAHLKLAHLRVAPAEKLFGCADATSEVAAAAAAPTDAGLAEALASKATITSVAVQAGSGSHTLSGCGADAWVTGEASHHEVLAVRHIQLSCTRVLPMSIGSPSLFLSLSHATPLPS
jgi:putative NIF3 family GTP cyclohydrolase 1 type 2